MVALQGGAVAFERGTPVCTDTETEIELETETKNTGNDGGRDRQRSSGRDRDRANARARDGRQTHRQKLIVQREADAERGCESTVGEADAETETERVQGYLSYKKTHPP